MSKIDVIFIIDDDPIFTLLAKKLLSKVKLAKELYFFSNGEEACRFLKSNQDMERPEVIFLDLNMPMMDGWDFMEELQCMDFEPKVIIVSSSIQPEDIAKSKTYRQVVDYVSKPLSFDKINHIAEKMGYKIVR